MAASSSTTTDDLQLLTVGQVCRLASVTRSTLYRLMSAGTFPRPLYVTSKTPRWRRATIRRWLDEREHAALELTDRADTDGRTCSATGA